MADELRGTGLSLDEAVRRPFPGRSWPGATADDGLELNRRVFLRETCDWRRETAESDGWICRECA